MYLSVAAQLRALRDHARKSGYIVASEYVDETERGRIADRLEFPKMIDAASKPNAPFPQEVTFPRNWPKEYEIVDKIA